MTLIAFFSLVDCNETFSLFLFAYNNLVRHLLEFALANLVAEFLMLSASAATPRSSHPASGLPRHSACTLFLHEGAEVGHFVCWSYGCSRTFCAVGLYFMGCPVHSVPAQPHKTEPRFNEQQYKIAASLVPKGALSLTQNIFMLKLILLNKLYFQRK